MPETTFAELAPGSYFRLNTKSTSPAFRKDDKATDYAYAVGVSNAYGIHVNPSQIILPVTFSWNGKQF
jgi:hypothetical protein